MSKKGKSNNSKLYIGLRKAEGGGTIVAKRNYTLHYYRRKDKKWDWKVTSPNRKKNNIVATSGGQGFERKDGAVKNYRSLTNAITDGRVRVVVEL